MPDRKKVALVTGAAIGIGRAVALELASAGFDLIINDKFETQGLSELVGSLQSKGHQCGMIAGDVFVAASRENLVEKAIETAGSIDVLVCVPAKNIRKPFLKLSLEEFESVVASILTSSFHLAQLVGKHMVNRQKGGKVVFISSIHADMPLKNNVAYNAAKAGLNHLTATIAAELCEFRINVNAVAPGWIDTPGERAALRDDDIVRRGLNLPWGRIGVAEDVAKSVAFLCSSEADYITGSILTVDGGFRFQHV